LEAQWVVLEYKTHHDFSLKNSEETIEINPSCQLQCFGLILDIGSFRYRCLSGNRKWQFQCGRWAIRESYVNGVEPKD